MKEKELLKEKRERNEIDGDGDVRISKSTARSLEWKVTGMAAISFEENNNSNNSNNSNETNSPKRPVCLPLTNYYFFFLNWLWFFCLSVCLARLSFSLDVCAVNDCPSSAGGKLSLPRASWESRWRHYRRLCPRRCPCRSRQRCHHRRKTRWWRVRGCGWVFPMARPNGRHHHQPNYQENHLFLFLFSNPTTEWLLSDRLIEYQIINLG